MIDISKFVTIGEDGKPVIDSAGYESAYERELRKSLDTNSENTKKKLEAEIRKTLEDEAKLTAEQKLQKERDDFESEKQAEWRKIAQERAKFKMTSAGMEEDEVNTYLELVTNDADIAKIDKILGFRTKRADTLKKQFEETLTSGQPNPQGGAGAETADSLGKQQANKYQNKSQTDGPKVTAWGN